MDAYRDSVRIILESYENGASLDEAILIARNIMDQQLQDRLNLKNRIVLLGLKSNPELGYDKSKEDIRDFCSFIHEEFTETNVEIQKIVEGNIDYRPLVSELLDELQLRMDFLIKLHKTGKINVYDEVETHNLKLLGRGWEYDSLYYFLREG